VRRDFNIPKTLFSSEERRQIGESLTASLSTILGSETSESSNSGSTFHLELGVMDGPHWSEDTESATTVYEVALELESTYQVMGYFGHKNGQFIADSLASSINDNLAFIADRNVDVFDIAEDQIEERFREFLQNKELDGFVPDSEKPIPTMAAQKGIVRGEETGVPRQSFIDSGDYLNAFAVRMSSE